MAARTASPRIDRGVGPVEREIKEEGTCGIPAAQELDGTGHDPRVAVQLLREMAWARIPRVAVDTVIRLLQPSVRPLPQPFVVIVHVVAVELLPTLVRLDRMEPEVGTLRIEMGLADDVRLIPGRGEFAGQRGFVTPRDLIPVSEPTVRRRP